MASNAKAVPMPWHYRDDWMALSNHSDAGYSYTAEIILGMGSANDRRRYYVTPPFIGRAHTKNDPCRGPDVVRRCLVT